MTTSNITLYRTDATSNTFKCAIYTTSNVQIVSGSITTTSYTPSIPIICSLDAGSFYYIGITSTANSQLYSSTTINPGSSIPLVGLIAGYNYDRFYIPITSGTIPSTITGAVNTGISVYLKITGSF